MKALKSEDSIFELAKSIDGNPGLSRATGSNFLSYLE